jgi:TolB-like protein
LSHPNIVSIYDAELEHPPLYLVTELLEGETLRHRMVQSPVPWRVALEIASAIADGLSAAHEASIVHRDLKPENIFVTHRGGVKILDFGLARFRPLFQQDCSQLTISVSGSFLGTVGYVAPEQARGEAVTAAADVFSLGCILYEMISGRPAFQRSTAAATITAILSEEPESVTGCVGDIPSQLDRWIGHCLRKDPNARPQSARDLELVFKELTTDPQAGSRVPAGNKYEHFDSLAVLPFVTSVSSPDAEYLADGITESLINNFAQLSHLRVIARSTVFRHKGKDVDPIEVGRKLGVTAVLTGRVFQRGDILVIASELVSVRDGRQLWGQQYKRPLADIFVVEEEISHEISERLRGRFAYGDSSKLARRYTENSQAYQLYLKGRFSWNKRSIEGMRAALHYFDQAVEVDAGYARAYTGLADCLMMLSIYGAFDARQAHTRAKAAQAMALEVDPGLGEAHASRGMRLLVLDRCTGEAEQALRRALELNPGYASAH